MPPRWRESWVYEYFNEEQYMYVPTHVAVVSEKYKYVRFPEGRDLFKFFSGEGLLFDLERDPYELENLANSESHVVVKANMQKQLIDFAKQYGFRFFPPDPDRVNARVRFLYNDKEHAWFKMFMDKTYPDGYEGWQAPTPEPLY